MSIDFKRIKLFIEAPVENILYHAIDETDTFKYKMEFYPIYKVMSKSVFLEMMGAQEQKLLYIHSFYRFDNSARYTKLGNYKFSSYDDKNNFYKELQDVIRDFNCFDDCELIGRLLKYERMVEDSFFNSFGRDFNNNKNIKYCCEKNKDDKGRYQLLSKEYELIYTDYAYKLRNQIAHNAFCRHSTTSNLLFGKDFQPNEFNYFDCIKSLIIIDEKFVQIYKKMLINF